MAFFAKGSKLAVRLTKVMKYAYIGKSVNWIRRSFLLQ